MDIWFPFLDRVSLFSIFWDGSFQKEEDHIDTELTENPCLGNFWCSHRTFEQAFWKEGAPTVQFCCCPCYVGCYLLPGCNAYNHLGKGKSKKEKHGIGHPRSQEKSLSWRFTCLEMGRLDIWAWASQWSGTSELLSLSIQACLMLCFPP